MLPFCYHSVTIFVQFLIIFCWQFFVAGFLLIIDSVCMRVYNPIMKKKAKESVQSEKNGKQTDAVKAAIEYGVDISILKDNLKRTPAERIKRHQIALNTVEKLKKARFI